MWVHVHWVGGHSQSNKQAQMCLGAYPFINPKPHASRKLGGNGMWGNFVHASNSNTYKRLQPDHLLAFKLVRELGLVLNPSIMRMKLKGMAVEGKGLDLQALRRRKQRKLWLKRNLGVQRCCTRPKRIIIKRRGSVEGSGKHLNGVGRRIKVLQEIVPNGDSMCLDRLFMEVADYIVCLEMQVKFMQIMFKVLSNSNQ